VALDDFDLFILLLAEEEKKQIHFYIHHRHDLFIA